MKRSIVYLVAATLVAFSMVLTTGAFAAQSPQIPLAGSAIPQFMQPLPTLSIAPQNSTINTVFGNVPLTITMCEFKASVLPPGAVIGYTGTWVWGYLVDTTGNSNCADLINQYKNPTTGLIDSYLGPVIVNQRGGASTNITWVNNLGTTETTGVLAYKYSTDQTLHWADPLYAEANDCNHMAMYPMPGTLCASNYGEGIAGGAPIPAVVHLHGGEVPAEIDGGPDAWFTSDGLKKGHGYYNFGGVAPTIANSATYAYPNTQEAAPIWFHDHTLGATRLNVYAGLAGGYYIYDPALNLPANLQPLTEVLPIILQDRMFDTNGQLFFQADSAGNILWATNPEHPYWSPEFVGDTIVVNGKAWPYLNVQPKRYRFLFLNGSNARTYEMNLVTAANTNGPPIWVIGTDGGYLDTPVKLDPALGQRLLMQPGERYEVIIDFAGFPGTNLVINNIGRTPYPKGAPPTGNTLGKLMQFRVAACPPKKQGGCPTDASYNPASGTPLRSGTQVIQRLVNPTTGTLAVTAQKTRQLTLNEVMGMPMTVTDPVTGVQNTAYPGGPLEILVNNTKWSGERIKGVDQITSMYTKEPIPGFTLDGFGFNYVSETPTEGETEVWEIVNLTADAHPIHLHLVQFQLINRQAFNVTTYTAAYNAAFPGGGWDFTAMPQGLCAAGAFCPGYGPPLAYAPSAASGNKYGGNPDVGATKMVKGKMQPLYLQGTVKPPLPQEAGWKDTVITYPGEVTRIAIRYAPTDKPTTTPANFPFDPSGGGMYDYVWHCHIIDHEDNEMMRPAAVMPMTGVIRTLTKGIDY